jgi:hypothetical protein
VRFVLRDGFPHDAQLARPPKTRRSAVLRVCRIRGRLRSGTAVAAVGEMWPGLWLPCWLVLRTLRFPQGLPAVTFPGHGRLTGAGPLDDPGPTTPAVRELVPRFGPDRDTGQGHRRHRGVPAGAPPPASCAVTRDQLHRQGAMTPCGMHDGRSTGATAIREDPVRGICGILRAGLRCINIQAEGSMLSRPRVCRTADSGEVLVITARRPAVTCDAVKRMAALTCAPNWLFCVRRWPSLRVVGLSAAVLAAGRSFIGVV